MPVVLPIERLDEWLAAEPSEAVELIRPAPEDALVATSGSKRVISVKNDDADCVVASANGPI
jgi:putative SOS response-associated peptidase YedK